MQLDEAAQSRRRRFLLGQRGAQLSEKVGHLLVEEAEEKIVFALEIEVDGAVGHARHPGDLGHRGAVKTASGEDLDGRVEDARALVLPESGGRRLVHRVWMNEGSFR